VLIIKDITNYIRVNISKYPPVVLLLIIIICGFSLNVTGQDEMISPNKLVRWNIRLPERLSIGVMSGSNLSIPLITHIPENTYGFKPGVKFKPGWQVGLTGDINVSGKCILFIDIQYLREIAYTEYDLGEYKDTYQDHFQMISIPSVISYRLGKGGIKYYPMAGFSIHYLISSKIDYSYHPYSNIPSYSYNGNADLLSDRNRFNYSAVMGTGFSYQIRKYFISLEIRYCHDLRNYISTDEMRTIQISSEYGFPFSYQSPGFRMHGIHLNICIQKAHL